MLKDFQLTGKSAVITGGAKGIGRAIAKLFVEAGANVIITDRDEAAGTATVAELNAQRAASARLYVLDVTDKNAAERVAEAVANEIGVPDILVNNAGIVRNAAASDVTEDDWRAVITRAGYRRSRRGRRPARCRDRGGCRRGERCGCRRVRRLGLSCRPTGNDDGRWRRSRRLRQEGRQARPRRLPGAEARG